MHKLAFKFSNSRFCKLKFFILRRFYLFQIKILKQEQEQDKNALNKLRTEFENLEVTQ